MKINDIYTNLEKKIDLREYEVFLGAEFPLNQNKNIDSIRINLKKINLKKNIKIKNQKLKIDNFDWVNKRKIKKEVNLKTIIKNSKKLKYKIINYLSNLHFSFQNKNKLFRISSYAILILSILFFNKILIQNLVSGWINNLYNIQYSNNIYEIETELSKANTKFSIANILFIPFKIIPGQDIKNASNWISALKEISQLWLDFSVFYKKNIIFFENRKITEVYFANLLKNAKPFFINTENRLKKIDYNLSQINLQDTYSNRFKKLEKLKQYTKLSFNKLSFINNNFETFLNILGKNRLKRYFIVFQNSDEIRPTWGFMWSAWIIEIFAWKVKSFQKRDIYAYEWDSKKNYTWAVEWPTWINLLSERLWLRDSNAFIDISRSSKSINYFMKKWLYDLDWIIFINKNIILDIIYVLWDIKFGQYNTIINHTNFSEQISILVNAQVSKKATLDTPKQVLFDFSELFKKKIKSEKKYYEIFETIINNIKSRDIVFYSFNKSENEFLKKLWVNWYFDYKKQTDFNFPFFISVWWNKSDRFIERKYIKNITINQNKYNNLCTLYTDFEIILKNTFSKKDEKRIIATMEGFRVIPTEDRVNIAWKWLNQSFTKVLIPQNAILNYDNLKKYWINVVKTWDNVTVEKLLKTKPWNKSYFKFYYKIENIDCKNHNFKVYKQAGINKYDIYFKYINNKTNVTEKLKLYWLDQDFYYNK